jgi:hypothetical protein
VLDFNLIAVHVVVEAPGVLRPASNKEEYGEVIATSALLRGLILCTHFLITTGSYGLTTQLLVPASLELSAQIMKCDNFNSTTLFLCFCQLGILDSCFKHSCFKRNISPFQFLRNYLSHFKNSQIFPKRMFLTCCTITKIH